MLIEAVIFDMDGLMLDTEPVYRAAWQQAAAECGYALPDTLYAPLIGRKRLEAEQMLIDQFGAPFLVSTFRAACKRLEAAAFAASPVQKKPGLDELLEFLDERRVPKAVATSSGRSVARQLLTSAGLLARFDALATSDEVKSGKPSPDVFQLAAQRLSVAASACLVLEDSEPGVVAAHVAEMNVFLVPDGKTPTVAAQHLAQRTFDSLGAVVECLSSASADAVQWRR